MTVKASKQGVVSSDNTYLYTSYLYSGGVVALTSIPSNGSERTSSRPHEHRLKFYFDAPVCTRELFGALPLEALYASPLCGAWGPSCFSVSRVSPSLRQLQLYQQCMCSCVDTPRTSSRLVENRPLQKYSQQHETVTTCLTDTHRIHSHPRPTVSLIPFGPCFRSVYLLGDSITVAIGERAARGECCCLSGLLVSVGQRRTAKAKTAKVQISTSSTCGVECGAISNSKRYPNCALFLLMFRPSPVCFILGDVVQSRRKHHHESGVVSSRNLMSGFGWVRVQSIKPWEVKKRGANKIISCASPSSQRKRLDSCFVRLKIGQRGCRRQLLWEIGMEIGGYAFRGKIGWGQRQTTARCDAGLAACCTQTTLYFGRHVSVVHPKQETKLCEPDGI